MFHENINEQLQFNNQLKIKKNAQFLQRQRCNLPTLCFHNAVVLIILNFEQNVIIIHVVFVAATLSRLP